MKCILLICILLPASLNAQMNPGSRSIAMGSAGIALQDVWSLQQNSAGIANMEHSVFAMGYEQHFLNPELSTKIAVFALPLNKNVFGFSFQRYGFSDYLEQTTGLSYSRSFSGTLSLSIVFKHHQLSIPRYGSAQAISVDAGMQYRLTDKIRIASKIANPGRSRFEALSGSIIPLSITIGTSYDLSDKVLVITDLYKELGLEVDTRLGLEYQIINWFYLRGGLAVNPFLQSVGFGLKHRKIFVDAAVSSHPKLGLSPNISLGYEF